jgi:uncharacterized protein
MVVSVDDIQEDGLELNEPISMEFLVRALGWDGKDTGFRPLKGSVLQASLQKVSEGVFVEGKFTARVCCACKRCLRDVSAEVPVRFALNLVSRPWFESKGLDDLVDDESAEHAGSFDLEDADEEWFDGKTIDLAPIIREQLLLALPMNLVCREDCKGLCTVCGQDLNERACGCEPKALDPRLAVLKSIKLN